MSILKRAAFVAVGLALAVPSMALADTYTAAHFTGGIQGGSANAKAPFNLAGITQGMAFSGTFLIDNSIAVPGSGSFNEIFSTYADAGAIPGNVDLAFTLGSLSFNSSTDAADGVAFKNGHFNGFTYNTVFNFQNTNYLLNISSGILTITDVATSSNFVNGFINIGDANVTGKTPFTPAAPGGPGVPEPATWAMMIAGFGGVGAMMRRRRGLALTA